MTNKIIKRKHGKLNSKYSSINNALFSPLNTYTNSDLYKKKYFITHPLTYSGAATMETALSVGM